MNVKTSLDWPKKINKSEVDHLKCDVFTRVHRFTWKSTDWFTSSPVHRFTSSPKVTIILHTPILCVCGDFVEEFFAKWPFGALFFFSDFLCDSRKMETREIFFSSLFAVIITTNTTVGLLPPTERFGGIDDWRLTTWQWSLIPSSDRRMWLWLYYPFSLLFFFSWWIYELSKSWPP